MTRNLKQVKLLSVSVTMLVLTGYYNLLITSKNDVPLTIAFTDSQDANNSVLTADHMIRICKASPDLWCDALLPLLNKLDAVLFNGSYCKTHNDSGPFKVSYLKTHKTGSSTLSSIMYRYAEFNDLIHLLPIPVGSPYNTFMRNPWDEIYNKFHMYEFFGYHAKHYDISKWDDIKYYFPRNKFGPNTVFTTIIRDPGSNFESSYSYFGKEDLYNKTAKEYLEYLNNSEDFYITESFKPWYDGINPQIKDLGLPPELTLKPEPVKTYISKLEKHMTLVLINEVFDESLVLLANRLCLPLRNVTYFSQKQRRNNTKVTLDAVHLDIIKRRYKTDYLLYDTFFGKHKMDVNEFGINNMKLAVNQLQELNSYIEKKCGAVTVDTKKPKNRSKRRQIRERLTVKHVENSSDLNCFYLSMLEEGFKNRIYAREKLRWQQRRV